MVQVQSAQTVNLGYKVLETNASGQVAKANENYNLSELYVQGNVKDKDLTAPPGVPLEGDMYLIASASPTGGWAGYGKRIVGYFNAAWVATIAPKKGWRYYVQDEDKYYKYDGTNWVEDTGTTTTAPTWTVVAKTANFTASVSEAAVYKIDATSGAVTVTLPAAASTGSRAFTFKRTDSSANAVTVDANASETIDGQLTWTIDPQQSLTIVCDGSNWLVI